MIDVREEKKFVCVRHPLSSRCKSKIAGKHCPADEEEVCVSSQLGRSGIRERVIREIRKIKIELLAPSSPLAQNEDQIVNI